MKFTYHFVNDEAAEIEIPEEWGSVILELDGDEKNNNRKHSRRRPVPLEDANYEGKWFEDGTDILGDLIRREDGERLRASLSMLNPGQQELIHRIYFLDEKVIRVAEEQGVTEAAIRDRLKKYIAACKKICNRGLRFFLSRGFILKAPIIQPSERSCWLCATQSESAFPPRRRRLRSCAAAA